MRSVKVWLIHKIDSYIVHHTRIESHTIVYLNTEEGKSLYKVLKVKRKL